MNVPTLVRSADKIYYWSVGLLTFVGVYIIKRLERTTVVNFATMFFSERVPELVRVDSA